MKSLPLLTLTTTLLAASAHAGSTETAPVSKTTDYRAWLDGDYATGDWGGLRTQLADKGVSFFGNYNAIVAGNPVGGLKHRTTYADDFYFGLRLDLQKLMNWEGATFSITGVERDGTSVKPTVGSIYEPMQLVGGQTIFLYQITLEQKFLDDQFSLKLGRMSAGDDFATSPLYGYYLSNGIDGNIRAALLDTRFSAYPFAVWGARLRYDPTPEWNAMVGIYQASSTMYDSFRHGIDYGLHSGDGFTLHAQVGWTPELFKRAVAAPTDGKSIVDPKSASAPAVEMKGMPGHYFLGGWYSSWQFPQFGSTSKLDDSFGLYLHADQMVYQETPGSDQGLTVFSTFTYAPQEKIALVPLQVSGGALYRGLIPGRDNDMTIFGVTYGKLSGDYAREVVATGASKPHEEVVLEGGYRIQPTKWCYLQPDVQWIINPGGSGAIPNALVVGAQFGLAF
ncbi:MAG: carbohydrate porin [Chthoniobacteraceae bacterium]